jgi:hypothetical protein
MVFLLSLLSFIAVAAGVFGLGVGVPIRETWFGASLLVAASVAIMGGFILVGLATAVYELRRVVQGFKAPPSELPRPVRPLERSDERIDGADRSLESRPQMPVVLGAGAADLIRRRYGAADTRERWHKSRSEAWLRHLQDEIESGSQPVDAVPPPINDYHAGDVARPSNARPRPAIPLPPDPPPYPPSLPREGRIGGTPGVSPDDIFDAIWSSQRRNIAEGLEPRAETSLENRLRSADSKSPPLAPGQRTACASTRSAPAEPRPLPILRAGVIRQMAYTLFADGSIEAQMSEGVMRFTSIEEFLGHLEKGEG